MKSVIILTWDEYEDAHMIKKGSFPRTFRSVNEADEWGDENDSEFGDYYLIVDLMG